MCLQGISWEQKSAQKFVIAVVCRNNDTAALFFPTPLHKVQLSLIFIPTVVLPTVDCKINEQTLVNPRSQVRNPVGKRISGDLWNAIIV